MREVGDLGLVDRRPAGLVRQLDCRERDGAHVVIAGQGVEHVVVVVEIVGRQRLANGGDGLLDLAGAQVGDRGHALDRDLLLGQLLDVEQQSLLARLGERDGHTLATGSADTTDAVHVALRGRRHVVVDHVRQRVDIEPACGDVGRDQQLGGAVAKAAHDAVALRLIHSAVQRLGAISATVHRLGQLVDLDARAAEDERGLWALRCRGCDRARRACASAAPCTRSAESSAVPGVVSPRPIWMRTGSRWYFRARALMRAGIVAENSTVCRSSGVACRMESMSSAKPMSSISSASSRITVRIAVELQRAAADVIEGAAGRGHDDVHATIERLQLPEDRLAAVDRGDLDAELASVPEDRLADLHRQLAGRYQDQARTARPWPTVSIICSTGNANAAVLPVPVAAWPSRSRPASRWGMVWRWIGVGSS